MDYHITGTVELAHGKDIELHADDVTGFGSATQDHRSNGGAGYEVYC